MHYVRDCERVVRAPRGVRQLERRWAAAEKALWPRLGREPQECDIAEVIGASAEDIREVRAYRATNQVVSFELLGGLCQCVAPPGIDEVSNRLTVERLLTALSPLERRIVRAIHLDGSGRRSRARLGYSRRHVTRLHRAALERLKRAGAGS